MRLIKLALAAALTLATAPAAMAAAPAPSTPVVSNLEAGIPADGRYAFLSVKTNKGAGKAANYVSLPGRPVPGGFFTVWSVDIFAKPLDTGDAGMASYAAALMLVDCSGRRVSLQRGVVYDASGGVVYEESEPGPWMTEQASDSELSNALNIVCAPTLPETVQGIAAMRADAAQRMTDN